MEPKEVKTLFLLEAIDKEDCQSQRELSRKLNMSLGLVNAFIKKLSNQGLFEIVHLPKGKVRYTLTPRGKSERGNLSNRYTSYLIEFYKETKNRLQLGFNKLYDNGIQNIILYGATELSEIACTIPHQSSQKVVAIIDNGKDGESVNGVKIVNESELHKIPYDAVIITDNENSKQTKEKLIKLRVPAEKIIALF